MKHILTATLLTGLFFGAQPVRAADKSGSSKTKPYPFNTCIVTDEAIDEKGAMKPHVLVHEGQEIKLCCKSCLKDFNKEPAKYLKKIK